MTNEEIQKDPRFVILSNFSSKIYEYKVLVFDLQVKYDLLKKEQELKKQSVIATIATEKTDDGKKKFGNEDQRQTEFQKRLENDEKYHSNEKELQSLYTEIQRKVIEISYLLVEMENYRLFVK
jgi:hypothetical protein